MSMSINGNSIAISPSVSSPGVQGSQVNKASDPDGDGDGGGHRVHKSRGGGGQMHQAMMQALQSLGLSMPQPASGSNAANQTSGSTDSDGDKDGSTSATSGIKSDVRQLMHALFQAVKGETASDTSGTGTKSSDPKANFAAGLSALIAQVSNGSAPADLQSAFSKVAADLQQTNAASSSTGSGSSGTGTASTPQATLQALLTQLQQNLGYGSSNMSATGNIVNTQA